MISHITFFLLLLYTLLSKVLGHSSRRGKDQFFKRSGSDVTLVSGQTNSALSHESKVHRHYALAHHGVHHIHPSHIFHIGSKKNKVDLPDAAVYQICTYFSFNTVLSLRLVNKQFDRVIRENLYKLVQLGLICLTADMQRASRMDPTLMLVSSAALGYAAWYPCPIRPPHEVIRWILQMQIRSISIAVLMKIEQGVTFQAERTDVPRPVVCNWGKLIAFYWKFVENNYGKPLTFKAEMTKFDYNRNFKFKNARNLLDFANISDKHIIALSTVVMQLYVALNPVIAADKIKLFDMTFALGPEYIVQWADVMNIFLPRTTQRMEKKEEVVKKTQAALQRLNIDYAGPSFQDLLRKEMESRNIHDIGEETLLH
ncbi:hypothetical protein V1514DRAFT_333351 [Lipomyces japonicus]|uniref:uncharacterized protein n=1 Tax=Lipomyces japonicus TaxID=56871 RepID=UPI0034CD4D8E